MADYFTCDVPLGAHVQKLPKLTESIIATGNLPAIQLYIASSRGYKPPIITQADIDETNSVTYVNNKYIVIHGCLLYNLCGSTDGPSDPSFNRKLNNTISGLKAELSFASRLDNYKPNGEKTNCGVIVHIGSSKDKQRGIDQIIKTIETVLDGHPEYRIILENAAGEGSKIGSLLSELGSIISGIPIHLKSQISVCIDTAHIFGAGQYDFGIISEVDRFYKEFDELIGLQYLEVFHLNDSRVPFNSKKDRHEYICHGYIFGKSSGDNLKRYHGLYYFIDEAAKRNIPMILETPGTYKDGTIGLGAEQDYRFIKFALGY